MPQQDDNASELHETEEAVRMVFPARDQAPEVLKPCEKALDLLAASIPPQRTAVLALLSIPPVGRDELDPSLHLEPGIQHVAVVRLVTDDSFGGSLF